MHIGLVVPFYTGHLNPATTLGAELRRQGHRVTLVAPPPAYIFAKKAGLEFAPIQIPEHESGLFDVYYQNLAQSENIKGMFTLLYFLHALCESYFRDLPKIIDDEKFDALLIDEILCMCMSVADVKKIPYGTISNAMPVMYIDDVSQPSLLSTNTYNPTPLNCTIKYLRWWGEQMIIPHKLERALNVYRAKHGLDTITIGRAGLYSWKSGCIQLTQQPSCFEYPREKLPGHWFYTTPWHNHGRDPDISFPWDRLNGKPIVYVSLGTLFNEWESVFIEIGKAFEGLDAQIVIALGKRGATLSPNVKLPEDAIVADYAPQLKLLEYATVVVTHCGLNTVLESLSFGKPIVAMPICGDQLSVAGRLKFFGAGIIVADRPSQITSRKLSGAIKRVLQEPTFSKNAMKLRDELKQAPSLSQVAKLIEVALTRGKPLLRSNEKTMEILNGKKVFPLSHKEYQSLSNNQHSRKRMLEYLIASVFSCTMLLSFLAKYFGTMQK